MSDKKQKAVEWQFDELQKAEKDWRYEAIDGKEYIDKKYQILNQSKEMEHEQRYALLKYIEEVRNMCGKLRFPTEEELREMYLKANGILETYIP